MSTVLYDAAGCAGVSFTAVTGRTA